MTRTIALLVGTRPEIIKMLPLYRHLKEQGRFKVVLLSTGQQRELSRQAFESFAVVPDVDLDIMVVNQSLPSLTAELISRTSRMLQDVRPDVVLVHGDTTTALAGALAAFYCRIPVGHVEAGLRTYNFHAPWPEEMNRRLIDPLCRWCFAPTDESAANLRDERIPSENIFITGNTVVDALLNNYDRIRKKGVDFAKLGSRLGLRAGFIARLLAPDADSSLILVTGHRRESFGRGFEEICNAILELAVRNPQVGILYPLHLNPNVQAPVRRILGDHERIQLISPLDYEDFIILMAKSRFIMTDSGGVQEEAPSLGKPVLVMRETTERPEGIRAGTSRLVGTDKARIVSEAELLLNDQNEYACRRSIKNPYGDGSASKRISDILEATTGISS